MSKALVLLSGGLDSATCLGIAMEAHAANVCAVSFIYGQKHDKEVWAARAIADHYHIDHTVIELPNIFKGSGSTLIDANKQNPECSYDEITGVSPTYVPFRNGILVSYATAYALTKEAGYVYFGAHSEDAEDWAYPDCTPEFIGSMAAATYVGTYHKVRLLTPLQWLAKRNVVSLGLALDIPFNLTWSCYNGREVACGVCPTCRSRRDAFAYNGLRDPITYADEVSYE